MHILHVAAPAPYGGLESVIRSLAKGQQSAGCSVDVVAIHEPLGEAHPFVAALTSDGIRAHSIEIIGRAYRRERAAVRALCLDLKPSIVHTHGYRPDVIDAPAARGELIPTVTSVHGFTSYGLRGKLYELLQRRAFRRFDAVVAVSQSIAKKLVSTGVEPKRIYTIPNAVDDLVAALPRADARRELGLAEDDFVLGWVGRLSPEKGPDIFLDALGQLKDLNVVACIVGDGPQRSSLEAQATALGIADRIRWAGRIPDAVRVFGAFDVVALSSRTEGTPIVLIEAVHAGIPAIATRVGGVPDLVTDNEAFLVSPLSATEISAAVRLVQSAPGEAQRRALAASLRLKANNSHSAWVTQYDRVYRTLLKA